MMGNKLDIRKIGTYEIEIAKCGWLRLVWFADPKRGNRYEIQSNGEKIFETNYLWLVIAKYNELVQ